MTDHLSDSDLNEYVDGELAPVATEAAARHLAGCLPCAARVKQLRTLAQLLAALPREAASRTGRVAPTRATGRSPRARHRVLQVGLGLAAALVVFVGGMAVGRRAGAPPGPLEFPSARRDAGDAAATVQQAGTAYVEALARLNAGQRRGRANPHDQAVGREVALSTLYGATSEVAQLAEQDPASAQLVDVARALRIRAIVAYRQGAR